LANAEVVSGIAAALAARGHEVHVVTPAAKSGLVDGVRIHRALGTFAKARSSVPGRILEYLSFSVGAVASVMAAPHPDVIVVTSPPPTLGLVGVLVSAVRRSALVYVVQDLYPEVVVATGTARPGLLVTLLARAMKIVYRRSSAVVVIDPDFVERITSKVAEATVRVVRNGIDLGPFQHSRRDDGWLRSLGVNPRLPVVMYAGNVGRSQDLNAVAKATCLCGAQLVVHGGGSAMESLRRDAEHLGWAHVRFSDYVERERLGSVFASADLHVVPLKPDISVTSVPSKLLSIFASGRPALVCAEPTSAAARLVEATGAGWVVGAGDTEALTVFMDKALSNRDELDRRGAIGRTWALAEAGSDRCAAEYEKVLEEVLSLSERGELG
jgi:glycosyltransferase involved in cell wall biosynthesis